MFKKIYIHHKYTNEVFWYLFHGTDVLLEDVPANYYHTINEIEITTNYRNIEYRIIFCEEKNWDRLDGIHIFDFHLSALECGIITDRGYTHEFYDYCKLICKTKINSRYKLLKDKLKIFLFDWEGVSHVNNILGNTLLSHSHLYSDEFELNDINYKNQKYSFTHNISSFLFTSNLPFKQIYHLSDYFINKKDFSYKLSYSIRRILPSKLFIFNKLKELKNNKIKLTLSSYEDDRTREFQGEEPDIISDFSKNVEESSYIKKRGYGINDWGSESNLNNIWEMVFKLFSLADIEIIDEYITNESGWLTEKSVLRILIGKPFIPVNYGVYSFYDNELKKYGYTTPDIEYKWSSADELIETLYYLLENEKEWNVFRNNILKWVLFVRKTLIEILENNNSFLDSIQHENKKEIL